MKKLFIFTALFLFIFIKPVFAYDLTVSCGGSCDKSTTDPLFSSSIIWYPGHSETRSVQLTNNRGKGLDMTTSASNPVTSGALDDVLILTIKHAGNGTVYYTGTLTNFFAGTPVNLSSLSSGASVDLTYEVVMDKTAGNEYQNKSTVFDLNFNFSGDDENQSFTQNSSDNSSGDGGTGGTQNSVGGSAAPTSAPTKSVIGLFVPRLSRGVVAGETTENPPEIIELPEEGQVGGAATCEKCTWWSILLIQAVALLIFYTRTKNKLVEVRKRSIVISILAYVLFLLVNNQCRSGFALWISGSSFFCNYFIVWVILIHSIFSRFIRHAPTPSE